MKESRKRLFVDKETGVKERLKIIEKAAGRYDTLVFSAGDKFFTSKNRNQKYMMMIKHYSFNIEAGGCDFSLLLPSRLFFFHRDLFRMEHGKRKPRPHFCPTNPQTTSRIKEQVRYLFGRAIPLMTSPRIFHLLPDEGQKTNWCSCPACRAFSPAEQYLIAVNAAADMLAVLDPEAVLLYAGFDAEPEAARIMPRKNTCVADE